MELAPRLTPPEKVLAPNSCNRPVPALVSEPVPEIMPAIVKVTLADTERMLAAPETLTGPARVRSPAAPALPAPMVTLAFSRLTWLCRLTRFAWNWDGPAVELPFCKTPPVRLRAP